jgi:3',5'-cyclic AMP phosphodiesterase CpdA
MFVLAHLSDLHTTPLDLRSPAELMNKRVLGWLSWQVRRKRIHRGEVLESLLGDLHDRAPDHVVVTGDLTNVALESEVVAARGWLRKIGSPEAVTAIPGNHDAYVSSRHSSTFEHWSDYMAADGAASGPVVFPAVRVRGPLALVGVSSATPVSALRAGGSLGEAQLAALEKTLLGLAETNLCRVVLVHHSPIDGVTPERRALWDRADFRAVLERAGAELVLHGHNHRTWVGTLPGRDGAIPVVGARSASEVGSKPGKLAQYHLYEFDEVEPGEGDRRSRFRVKLRARSYDRSTRRFHAQGERELTV